MRICKAQFSRRLESQALFWKYDAPHVATVIETVATRIEETAASAKVCRREPRAGKKFLLSGTRREAQPTGE